MQVRRFGRIEIRPGERQLLVNGERVEVGSRAFDLLLALLEHRDRVVSRDELLATVWPGVVVEESNLQVQVFALRKVLGPHAIATVSGRGYQFVLAEEASPAASLPATREADIPKRDGIRLNVRTFALPVLVALALAAGMFATFHPLEKRGSSPSGLTRAGDLSIVVLPFANLTGRADQDYIAHGLASSLTADLSRLRDTFIVDVATAFSYKDKAVTVRQLHDELGVRFVLQGNVQRSGDTIRIQVQLADAATSAQLWSESFEGDLSDLLALQDKVTGRVGNSIGREMIIVAARASQMRKDSPRAADLMLRARASGLEPRSHERLQQTASLYRQVLALEPDHVGAMVGLANSLVDDATEYSYRLDEATRAGQIKEAHDLALRVKDRDPRHPGPYRAISIYTVTQGDYAASRRALEEWVSLSPRNIGAHNNLAISFLVSGEPRRAIESLTRAMELAPRPGSWMLQSNMGRAYFMLGDHEAALTWLTRARHGTREPPRILMLYLAMAYAETGDDSSARAMTAQLLRHSPDFRASRFEPPRPTGPPAYKEWFETRFLPSARKAGIPE